MTNESTISLAARLAANLFVDAIRLAKPGARLAAKVGDRFLGGSPFNEREAQRFLTGGAERLNEFEAHVDSLDPGELCLVKCSSLSCGCQEDDRYAQAERDVYEPDPLWSAARVRELDDAHEFNTMPNWPKSSAPVAPKPADVDSPEVVASPVAASGSPHKYPWGDTIPWSPEADIDDGPPHVVAAGMTDMFLQLDDLGRTDVPVQCAHCRRIIPSPSVFGVHLLTCALKIADPLDAPAQETPDSQGEQPVGAGDRPTSAQLEIAVDRLLCDHKPWELSSPGVGCKCGRRYPSWSGWRAHVAPLIVQALRK